MSLAMAVPELVRPIAPFRKNVRKIEIAEPKPIVEKILIEEKTLIDNADEHEIIRRDVSLSGHLQYGVPAPVVDETYGPPPVAVVEVPHVENAVTAVHYTPDHPQDGRWINDVSNMVWGAGATADAVALPTPQVDYGLPAAVSLGPAPIEQLLSAPVEVTVAAAPHVDYGLPVIVEQPLPAPVEVTNAALPHVDYGLPAVVSFGAGPIEQPLPAPVEVTVVAVPNVDYGLPTAVSLGAAPIEQFSPAPVEVTVAAAPHIDYGLPAAVEQPFLSPVPIPTWAPTATLAPVVLHPYPAKTLFATHYGDTIIPSISVGTFFK
jgi:hypothetical protein